MSLIEHVLTKPIFYTNTGMLSEVLLFMRGYILALKDVDRESALLSEWWSFLNWLTKRLELHPVESWSSQLVNVLGDSKESVDTLRSLYIEFSATYDTVQIRGGAFQE